MRQKKHTAGEIIAKLRQVDVLVSQGRKVAEAIRCIEVTEVTYYRWRSEYGGLKGDQVKRLKSLETVNRRLRQAISDLTLENLILKAAASGNFFSILGSSVNAPSCASQFGACMVLWSSCFSPRSAWAAS